MSLPPQVIQSRRSSPVKEEDVLQQFCDARYQNVYNGRQLTEEEIAGLLIAVLFAGQHTSSITSSWTGYFMINDQVSSLEEMRSRDLHALRSKVTEGGTESCTQDMTSVRSHHAFNQAMCHVAGVSLAAAECMPFYLLVTCVHACNDVACLATCRPSHMLQLLRSSGAS